MYVSALFWSLQRSALPNNASNSKACLRTITWSYKHIFEVDLTEFSEFPTCKNMENETSEIPKSKQNNVTKEENN